MDDYIWNDDDKKWDAEKENHKNGKTEWKRRQDSGRQLNLGRQEDKTTIRRICLPQIHDDKTNEDDKVRPTEHYRSHDTTNDKMYRQNKKQETLILATLEQDK